VGPRSKGTRRKVDGPPSKTGSKAVSQEKQPKRGGNTLKASSPDQKSGPGELETGGGNHRKKKGEGVFGARRELCGLWLSHRKEFKLGREGPLGGGLAGLLFLWEGTEKLLLGGGQIGVRLPASQKKRDLRPRRNFQFGFAKPKNTPSKRCGAV